MAPTTIKLDWLPRDILRQIVTLGSYETILALSRVNKHLQHFCDDPGLYKSIIVNRRGRKVAKWYRATLSTESPISTWARYALADVKAAQCSLEPLFVEGLYGWPQRQCSRESLAFEGLYSPRQLRSDAIARFHDFASWGPQLIASHHPFVDSINTTSVFKFLSSFQWPSSSIEHVPSLSEKHDVRYALTFCLLIKLLDKDEPFLDWRHYPWCLRPRAGCIFMENWHSYTNTMEIELRHSRYEMSIDISLSDDRDNSEVTTETRHRLLIALALLSRIFRVIGNHSHLSPRNIPFMSMMELPPPLSLNASGDLATCHLSKMTSKEFFNDGLWIYGLYIGDRMEFAGVHVRGVAFVATQDDAHPTKLTLRGFGTYYRGDFSLEGAIAQETGRVCLVMRHTTPMFDTDRIDKGLTGVMTPFGIVGVHGSPGLGGGWFWLWKDAWTEKGMSPPYAW